jgi:predicted ABC-type ATPase
MQLLDEATAADYSTKVLFISTEDANLNVGRVLVRVSRGGQAVPVSSVIDSYRESTKNVTEVPKHADEVLASFDFASVSFSGFGSTERTTHLELDRSVAACGDQ